ncbi:sphingosine kinase [Actinoplanes sp. TBRC 11911]|uniref:diacylglycerol kinase family protein n=1 Tax=Actinoplanes sp. TBRC 11911 TaxID=2729386 RepID=UPI00145ED18F|nr:diacylglycerol kinase family protein [Actinoplanes sp. TBRC 11911]NMO53513.1 sphingosine kinase [Actinoplanes sp. TBRC 11911]
MKSDEIAVLANPRAGRGRHRDLVSGVVRRLGAAGHPVRTLTAASSEEAEEACQAAVAGGAAAVVAIGGDGTVHRVLQAVAGTTVPLGVVPAGTGNDFAAGTGVRGNLFEAAEAIGAALRDGSDHRIDLARIERAGQSDRWFGAVLAAGIDALVNERANRMRWPRGPRRYDLAIALELVRPRPRVYELVLDDADHGFEGTLVAVGNCASYGGGMRILPDADPADGLLDVVIAEPLGRAALVRLKPRMRRGTHVRDPRVTVFRARRVRLRSEGVVGYADGERVGPLAFEISCVPGAVRLLR